MKIPDTQKRRSVIVDRDYIWIVTAAEAKKCHDQLPGAQWLQRKREVHHDGAETYFPVDGEGRCANCRDGKRCRSIKLGGVDVSAAMAPRSAENILRCLYFDQLMNILVDLPTELRRKLRSFADEHFGELNATELGELRDVFHAATTSVKVPWPQPDVNLRKDFQEAAPGWWVAELLRDTESPVPEPAPFPSQNETHTIWLYRLPESADDAIREWLHQCRERLSYEQK